MKTIRYLENVGITNYPGIAESKSRLPSLAPPNPPELRKGYCPWPTPNGIFLLERNNSDISSSSNRLRAWRGISTRACRYVQVCACTCDSQRSSSGGLLHCCLGYTLRQGLMLKRGSSINSMDNELQVAVSSTPTFHATTEDRDGSPTCPGPVLPVEVAVVNMDVRGRGTTHLATACCISGFQECALIIMSWGQKYAANKR